MKPDRVISIAQRVLESASIAEGDAQFLPVVAHNVKHICESPPRERWYSQARNYKSPWQLRATEASGDVGSLRILHEEISSGAPVASASMSRRRRAMRIRSVRRS